MFVHGDQALSLSVNCTRASRVVVTRIHGISRLSNQHSFSPRVAKLVVALPRNHHHRPPHRLVRCSHGSEEELEAEKLQESGIWMSDVMVKKQPNYFKNCGWSAKELEAEKLQESGIWMSDVVDKKQPNYFKNCVWTAEELEAEKLQESGIWMSDMVVKKQPNYFKARGWTTKELEAEKLQESRIKMSDMVVKKRPNYFKNRVWTAKDLGYAGYMAFMHGLCLLAPATFSRNASGVFMGLYAITDLLVGARNNVDNMEKVAFYQFIQKTYPIHPIAMAVALYAMGGFPHLIWGMAVCVVWVYHIKWFVNSASHVWGSQKWNTGDLSRNNWWVAVLAFGEGWWIIRSLKVVGLATKAPEARLAIVENDVATLKSDVATLQSDVKTIKSEVEKITLESSRRWLISTIIMVLMLITQWIFKS